MKYEISTIQNKICWIAQLIASTIMLQTLFFKFTGADESIYIFSKLGMESWGRYSTGVAELLASILLLIPTLSWVGAALGAGIMSGAILFHITIIGISIKEDNGYLFSLAILTLLSCLIVLYIRKHQIPFLNKLIPNKL